MARRRANDGGLVGETVLFTVLVVGAMLVVLDWLLEQHPYVFYGLLAAVVLLGVGTVIHVLLARRKDSDIEEEKRAAEVGRRFLWREEERLRIESLLRRDAVRDEINYMSGAEFEKFMAALFQQKGYTVEESPASGDQGADLILPDYDSTRVVVQLKRWSGPVGSAVVGATFAGMAHYRADEGWIITTSTFTPKARELARSTRVRLIDGRELAGWLEDLKEEE